MRCFACNELVSGKELDYKTGRYYCTPCFEATASIMLSSNKADYDDYTSDTVEAPQLDIFGEEYSLEELEAIKIVELSPDEDLDD